uniref:Uncharacterized protein n=1 Tax=Schistosoma curassoni TaxID=6186 RepID=A0A183L1T4_9TREM
MLNKIYLINLPSSLSVLGSTIVNCARPSSSSYLKAGR